jgi:hypothetical protein
VIVLLYFFCFFWSIFHDFSSNFLSVIFQFLLALFLIGIFQVFGFVFESKGHTGHHAAYTLQPACVHRLSLMVMGLSRCYLPASSILRVHPTSKNRRRYV